VKLVRQKNVGEEPVGGRRLREGKGERTESKHHWHSWKVLLDEFDVVFDPRAMPCEFRVGERAFFGSEG
jgi:hypothetical protein